MREIKIPANELPYAVAEELKTLRTNIQFCGDDKKVFVITACLSGEGKSTTSFELSKSLAEIGKKVLLIDADLRRSVFKDRLKLDRNAMGLTHYLIGQAGINDVICAIENTTLHLIPAGPTPPNPAELLASKRMKNLIDAARGVYDYVIVDAPPLGMVVDANIIAPCCDGSMLLIEYGSISYKFAQDVLNKLKATGVPVVGAVLNKVDRTKDKYYGQYNNRYTKYY